jgi:GntR family transcriptional repressor for pyruvate dehydrogenase complex
VAVTDEAIAKIKEMILRGELRPGDRLPPEKELSERLGLSRNSMREAVKALEVSRVLDIRRGDGTFVTSLEPKLLLEAISFVVELRDGDTLLDVFEVRRVLEAHAASVAATRATPTLHAALAAELASVRHSMDIEALVAHDTRFHAAIAATCGNSYLSSLLENMSSQTVRARVWRGLTEVGAVARTLHEHSALVDAITDGDADLAASVMTTHIAGIERWLRRATQMATTHRTPEDHAQPEPSKQNDR